MHVLRSFLIGAVLFLSAGAFAVGVVSVDPVSYDFGALDIGASDSVVFEIGNAGDTALAINDISFAAGSSGDFAITDSSLALIFPIFFGPGASMTVEVTFAPSAEGPAEAVLAVDSSDGTQPVFEVPLVGEGIGGAVTPAEQIEAVIAFAEQAAADGTLEGDGPGKSAVNRLGALMNMLDRAQEWIEAGDYEMAAEQLESAYQKTDGENRPPDFVQGPAAQELATQILILLDMFDD